MLMVGVGGAVAAWYWSSAAKDGDGALQVLVTMFSILAGILITLMTLLGDPRTLYPGSWRIASAHRREIRRVLRRHAMLFCLYLVFVGLAFAARLLDQVDWIVRLALSVGVGAFIFSFGLPMQIARMQQERLDREVERRRHEHTGVAAADSPS